MTMTIGTIATWTWAGRASGECLTWLGGTTASAAMLGLSVGAIILIGIAIVTATTRTKTKDPPTP